MLKKELEKPKISKKLETVKIVRKPLKTLKNLKNGSKTGVCFIRYRNLPGIL